LVGGAVVLCDSSPYEKVRFAQNAAGAVPGPFDCWLVLRGIKTLAVRMDRHCSNAQKIAEHLSSHPKVEKTLYPGLTSSPTLSSDEADGRFWRDGQFLFEGGLRGLQKIVGSRQNLHARRKPWRS